MLVHEFLERSAARAANAVALIHGHRIVTYGELNALATRFARLFYQHGVARHDRVVIAIENSIEFAGAYFGALKAGAVAVPLPAGSRSHRLAAAVTDCGPAAAVVDAALTTETDPSHLLTAVPAVFVSGGRDVAPGTGFHRLADALAALDDLEVAVRPIDIDLAAIIYTSGSTGEPRGVMLSHNNIVANTRSIVSYLQLTAADRVMCVLPFYYVYGLSLLHTHVAAGGSLVIDNRFAFPNLVLKAMQEQAVTGFAGVPSSFTLLLHKSDLEQTALPSLRYVTQAGGAMPPARIREWQERGPKAPFYVMYGATEASARLTYLDPARLANKPGSIGRAVPNVEILVVRDDGTLAARREVGEICARGTNIAIGYWNDPKGTSERFGPFGYRTGDLGYADEDGDLFLVGRKHDMLKIGAHRVGAREIEDVLARFPDVSEAAVVGVPDDLLGEVPVAFLVLRDGVDHSVESIKAFCRAHLPAYKVPVRIEVRAEMPQLGAVGKIDKRALRALAEVPPALQSNRR